jgi:predicted kinase
VSQVLFLLCGLPFSGKSTMGCALSKQLGIVHVEVDRHHFDGDIAFVKRRLERADWIAAYRAAYGRADEALSAGMSVVFDAVSYRRLQRDRVRRIAIKHEIPMTIIYLDVEPEAAKARMALNRLNPMRPNVSDADFDEVSSGMQPPMSDELSISYSPVEPIDIWIGREIAPLVLA